MEDCYVKNGCMKYCDKCPDVTCRKLNAVKRLYDNAYIPETLRYPSPMYMNKADPDYENFKNLSQIKANIVDFVNGGQNLYFYSKNPGNGKTTWAVKLLKAYLYSLWSTNSIGCHGLFINVPQYFISLKDNFSNPSDYVQHIKDNYDSAELVVFDEVGVKGLTEFEHEHMLNMINTRINMGKANIYTSNMGPDELREKVGDRLFSRIYNLSTAYEFLCGDYRGNLHK